MVPIIEGGTYRKWPKTQDLQLSGEKSYDHCGPMALLHYHWECLDTSKVRGTHTVLLKTVLVVQIDPFRSGTHFAVVQHMYSTVCSDVFVFGRFLNNI